MVDATILDFFMIIFILFSAAIFHLCIQEMRNFPSIAITKTRDIQIANYVRIFTIIVSGLTLSYGLMTFGHSIGLGGLETLKDSKIRLFFAVLGLVATGSFFGSRIIDQKIYVDVANYEEVLDLSLIELKQKIRKEGKIKAFAKSRAAELEQELDKKKQRLDEETQAQYVESRKADSLTKELESKQRSLKNARALKNQTKKEIETTEEKLKADVALLALYNLDIQQLDKKLENVKQKHVQIDKILQPLKNTKSLKKKELESKTKELQNCIESVEQSRKEIEEISSELDDLKKKTVDMGKIESDFAENHEQLLQDVKLKQNELKDLQKEVKKYESVIETYVIAELSAEQERETLEILKRRTEEHFNQEQRGDDKIFTN